MSEIIEALVSVIEIVADTPASILIVLGFVAILIGWAFSVLWILALGVFMLIMGIIVHIIWLTT